MGYTGVVRTNYGTIEYDLTKIENFSVEIIDDEAMIFAHNLLAELIADYVPRLEGDLMTHIEVTPEYLRYISEYAHYQYFGYAWHPSTQSYGQPLHHPANGPNPLATSEWDKVAMQVRIAQFEQGMLNYFLLRIKEKHG